MINSIRQPRRPQGIADSERSPRWEFSVDALAMGTLNPLMNLRLFCGGAFAVWLLLRPALLPAATHYVGVDGQGFFPSTLTIAQGASGLTRMKMIFRIPPPARCRS